MKTLLKLVQFELLLYCLSWLIAVSYTDLTYNIHITRNVDAFIIHGSWFPTPTLINSFALFLVLALLVIVIQIKLKTNTKLFLGLVVEVILFIAFYNFILTHWQLLFMQHYFYSAQYNWSLMTLLANIILILCSFILFLMRFKIIRLFNAILTIAKSILKICKRVITICANIINDNKKDIIIAFIITFSIFFIAFLLVADFLNIYLNS